MNTKQILAELRAERNRIDAAIAALEALSTNAVSPDTPNPSLERSAKPRRKKRTLSADARKRISEAAKKRWAAVRKSKAPAKTAKQ